MMPAAENRSTPHAGRGRSSRRPSLRDFATQMSKLLKESGVESHGLDAQLIVTHVLGLDRLDIYRNPDLPVTPSQEAAIRSLIGRRASGLPTAYITSTKEFWSLPVSVDERVLKARLLDLRTQKIESERSETRKSQVGTGDRSERIRTYNFPQSRVTDHRIGLTLHRLDSVLMGNLDEIIDALITHYQTEALKSRAV